MWQPPQPQGVEQVGHALQQFGAAPGPQKLMYTIIVMCITQIVLNFNAGRMRRRPHDGARKLESTSPGARPIPPSMTRRSATASAPLPSASAGIISHPTQPSARQARRSATNVNARNSATSQADQRRLDSGTYLAGRILILRPGGRGSARLLMITLA